MKIINWIKNLFKKEPDNEMESFFQQYKDEYDKHFLTVEDYQNSLNEQISYKILCCEKEFFEHCLHQNMLKDSFGVMGYVVFERFKVDLVKRKKVLETLYNLENSYN